MSFTPEEAAAIRAQARANIADAKDFKPREVDILADLHSSNVVRFARPEPEPEPELRSLDDSRAEIIAAVVAEVTEALDLHRAFIADQLAEVVAALVDGSVEHVDKQVDALHTALLTQIETLRAETAQLRAEVARLSATEIADGRGGVLSGCVIKH